MQLQPHLIKSKQHLRLKDLKADCFIGVWPHEQEKRQPLRLDLLIEYDSGIASQTDELDDTLNYSKFAKVAKEFVEEHTFHLLETLSDRLAEFLFSTFSIDGLEIIIHKPEALKNLADISLKTAYRSCEK